MEWQRNKKNKTTQSCPLGKVWLFNRPRILDVPLQAGARPRRLRGREKSSTGKDEGKNEKNTVSITVCSAAVAQRGGEGKNVERERSPGEQLK